MRLDDEQESSNFEVQSGRSGGLGGGFGGGGGNLLGMLLPLIGSKFGCGGIAVVLILMAVMGGGLNLGSIVGGLGGGNVSQQQAETSTDASSLTEVQHISLKVLGSTERVWQEIFAENGQKYPPPTLVFYSQNGMSGCGAAQSAMGPFYCPADRKVYLDTDFFQELKDNMKVPGDFPMGYVIAHEVGHHIQTLTGISDKVRAAQQRGSEAAGNAMQVRMELQADCYAGVWAARDKNLLEPGDLEEGMQAAHAIGDDTLLRNAGRTPVESMFTHGTSEQRMRWLRKGLESGNPADCDTFSATTL